MVTKTHTPETSDLVESVRVQIRAAMKRHRVSKSELARRLGVTRARVGDILGPHKDANITLRTLSAICRVLGVRWVMTLEDLP